MAHKMFLTLNTDLVHALQELADWEDCPELTLAADLVRLALERAKSKNHTRFLVARLTPRERQVARYIRQGYNRMQVAAQLHITHETVRCHLRNIRRKLALRSTTDLYPLLNMFSPGLFE